MENIAIYMVLDMLGDPFYESGLHGSNIFIRGGCLDMVYAEPGQNGSKVTFKKRYDNYIGGRLVPPVQGQYFENVSLNNNRVFCEVARSTAEDIELALDAAHEAKTAWGRTSASERANMLNRIADRIEDNLELLAVAETWDNGKYGPGDAGSGFAACDRSFPLFRRLHSGTGRNAQPNRR